MPVLTCPNSNVDSSTVRQFSGVNDRDSLNTVRGPHSTVELSNCRRVSDLRLLTYSNPLTP